MYSFKSRIRFSETDSSGHLDLSSIINYFQDISMFHSEEVGLGLSYFQEHKKAWILSSWQIKVIRYPKIYETVTISTYPYAIKGVMGYRNFTLTDRKGELCAIADSSWIYMNMEQQKPVRVKEEDSLPYGIDPKLDMEYKKGKIQLPDKMDKLDPVPVLPSYIDSNHHVNNGQYVKLAKNYLPEHFHPTEIRVEYRNAAKTGDIIYPAVHADSSVCTISLNDANEKPFAVLEFVN
ncbi:acyl-[acyl-carrier-protein] thioesterase [[Clostridium] polysaccharolyticum]|uniref:Acyl-ACP thioesterase n=1 Tax=[Clostridium] polysaccharolyticum TaxID=29364 RepID=A0A1I0FXC1_9FIRM|nr:acyl-ACP thioesterase domain-containing protein [[Clostridium] polysaccharolyticum]SET62938.1 Acyl-ACP thioesterase [[Clostridium] polysaccharolyticum]